ncbi:hypothetical protein BKG82_27690 [Mycobacteroides chelonae]|uniref:Uncharacterized protein n=1 Tax=Mycobacteroides chelonae TaxID=1774 RepID=A0A1S1LCK5_MYCCH|nr:hypothetical protein [Mycobacteroides chelonae]OHU47393.1 hypothetical protein BKG82_27690 [Mycobacteroides chelonae]
MTGVITADRYRYWCAWSPEDRMYAGLVAEFPSLAWLAPDPDEAVAGVGVLVSAALAELAAAGEQPPAPLTRSEDGMTDSGREELQVAIAAQLAAGHGTVWHTLGAEFRKEFMADAEALIDQGMTSYWVDDDPGDQPSPELEAEAFEFARAMDWFWGYLQARHPEQERTDVPPSSHIESADPQDWDAWVTIAVQVSGAARTLWSRRFTQQHGEPLPPPSAALPPAAVSAPAAVHQVRRERTAAAIGAVLAHRHGRRWMELPEDLRAAYLVDANALISAGLTAYRG